MNGEKDRAEFEAWAVTEGFDVTLTTNSLCQPKYSSPQTQAAMDGWLAARRTQDEQLRELVEKVGAWRKQYEFFL